MPHIARKARNAQIARNALAAKRKRAISRSLSLSLSPPPPPPPPLYPEEDLVSFSDTDNEDAIELTLELQMTLEQLTSQPEGGGKLAEDKLPGCSMLIDETRRS